MRRKPTEKGAAGAPEAVTLTLRCRAKTHPISPLIYGIGAAPMHDLPDQWQLGASARRWGGNHTSRYNWELGNAWNTGKDWFFKNVDYDGKAAPAHQRFIDDNTGHGVATALAVPLIGWVARDTRSYGFPVSTFGPQRKTAPENQDIGDGVRPGGALVAPGPKERTSVPLPPASVGRWVAANRARAASKRSAGVQIYILDNEPTLWSETHRDVHPKPLSYDELLDKTLATATEIRKADPAAWIAGPALWGWTALFSSGVDKAAHPAHPDRDRHGGTPLLPWWLGEIAAHEARTGAHLLDLVDVHFYPQGKGIGVGTAGDTDLDTAARRIRSTRALWDPGYRDESWIAEEVKLIPRLESWIAERHPGLRISIGEYNFGAEGHMSGGLAVAEALGRFGVQGVSSAFYWDYPPRNTPAFWAFRAYRNFDGAGARFLDDSLPAASSDGRVSLFASWSQADNHLVAILLALDPTVPFEARMEASSCGRISSKRRFIYTAGSPSLVEATSGDDVLSTLLPPYSMTVLDLRFAPGS
ncbi:MAG: glycoside hydrolase family 44 protein [Minicystis sp.]